MLDGLPNVIINNKNLMLSVGLFVKLLLEVYSSGSRGCHKQQTTQELGYPFAPVTAPPFAVSVHCDQHVGGAGAQYKDDAGPAPECILRRATCQLSDSQV